MGKAVAKKAEIGRPTKYQPQFVERVHRLALLGLKDVEIAGALEICEATLNNWKNEHPEFLEAMRRGKIEADGEIAHGLHRRGLGYDAVEKKAIKVKEVEYQDGKRLRETERIEMVEETRHIPADTTAQTFWLKNRRRTEWRDSQPGEGVNVNVAVFAGIKIVIGDKGEKP